MILRLMVILCRASRWIATEGVCIVWGHHEGPDSPRPTYTPSGDREALCSRCTRYVNAR